MDFQNWIRSYVIQVIPIISLVIYILGFSYYIAYYAVFGINIITYITLSEVLVMAMAPIVVCILIGLVWGPLSVIYARAMLPAVKSAYSDIPSNIKAVINLPQKMWSINLRRRLMLSRFITSAIILILIFVASYAGIGIFDKRVLLICLVIAAASYVYNVLRWYRQLRLRRVKLYYYSFTWATIGVGIIGMLIMLGVSEGKTTMNSEPDFFEVVMSDGSRYAEGQYTYIGDSSTAVFIYDRRDSCSIVLNRQNVMLSKLRRGEGTTRLLKVDATSPR